MSAARQERFRTACVVGSRGGIGRAVVRRLGQSGYNQVLEMDLAGPIRVNLAEPASVERAFAEARSHTARLDALVVASGILDLGKLADLTLEQWNRVLAVNLTGPFLCCKHARDWLNDRGRIVLIGSLAGRSSRRGASPSTALPQGAWIRPCWRAIHPRDSPR